MRENHMYDEEHTIRFQLNIYFWQPFKWCYNSIVMIILKTYLFSLGKISQNTYQLLSIEF